MKKKIMKKRNVMTQIEKKSYKKGERLKNEKELRN